MEFVLVVLVVAFVRSEFADSAPDTEQEAVSAALYIPILASASIGVNNGLSGTKSFATRYASPAPQ